MSGIHSVLNLKNVKSFSQNILRTYMLSIILSVGKKNCSSMANYLEVPYSRLNKLFTFDNQVIDYIKDYLLQLVQNMTKQYGKGYLVVDGWHIHKRYSRKIEKSTYDYSGSHKQVVKGLAEITLAWTNGIITVPLETKRWLRKKDAGEEYLKKSQLMEQLLLGYKDKVDFIAFLADGGYCSRETISFFTSHNIPYLMRIPSNRKITYANQCTQIRHSVELQLKRNQRYKAIKAFYQGIPCFIVTHKRKGKNGTKQTVYIVSNIKYSKPKKYIEKYRKRWAIEKMFRTLKQHLGVSDCQSSRYLNQRIHLFATFRTYVELEIVMLNNRKKSVESILKQIRPQKIHPQHLQSIDLEGWFND